jgi:hypothetical protein
MLVPLALNRLKIRETKEKRLMESNSADKAEFTSIHALLTEPTWLSLPDEQSSL